MAQVWSGAVTASNLSTIVVSPLPTEVVSANSRVSILLVSSVRSWVQTEAASVAVRKLSASVTLSVIRNDVAARFAGQKIGPAEAAAVAMAVYTGVTDLNRAEAEAQLAKMKAQRAAMNELSQQDALALQKMLERLAQFESTLTNLLAEIAQVQAALLSNLK